MGHSKHVAAAASPSGLLDYRMFALRDEVTDFEQRLHLYLGSAPGRFEAWEAARQVRASRA
jgi:hypothetical protein